MTRIQFIFIIFILLLAGCKFNKNNKNISTISSENLKQNALLPTEVVVKHLFPLYSANEEWIKGFDYNKFLEEVLTNTKQEKIKVFDYANTYCNLFIPITKNEIDDIFINFIDTVEIEDVETGEIIQRIVVDELKKEEISQLFFKETWFLDNETFKMTKEVISYGLVKEFYRDTDYEKTNLLKKILFEVNFNNDIVNVQSKDVKDKKLLAENIKYEFSLDNESWVKDLDHEKFMQIVIDKIISGDVKTYDFYENSNQLSVKNIKASLDLLNDTIDVEDLESGEITSRITENDITPDLFGSYIFIEDWYIDKNTFKIIKEVKGIAPVYHFYRDEEDAELQKKIPFVVWF